jgi:endonuclease/exonuclease/phosphatase (EEP) superfamily protein YafD
LVVLGPLAGFVRRWMLVPVVAAAMLVLGPIMGFCLPWARLAAPRRPAIRVLTCNLKGHCKDNPALDALIRDAVPDIVALQGCWHQARVRWPEGWHAIQQGELLVASRYPLREVMPPQNEKRGFVLTCLIATPEGEIAFATLHPRSPHESFNGVLDHRIILRPSQSEQLEEDIGDRWRDAEQTTQFLENGCQAKIIVGDLNLPPESAIYRTFWARYRNAFSEAGLGFGYTEWPRMRRLRFGIRIDHILSTSDWQPRRCWVGPDVGSDHLPLIADLLWAPSGDAP